MLWWVVLCVEEELERSSRRVSPACLPEAEAGRPDRQLHIAPDRPHALSLLLSLPPSQATGRPEAGSKKRRGRFRSRSKSTSQATPLQPSLGLLLLPFAPSPPSSSPSFTGCVSSSRRIRTRRRRRCRAAGKRLRPVRKKKKGEGGGRKRGGRQEDTPSNRGAGSMY